MTASHSGPSQRATPQPSRPGMAKSSHASTTHDSAIPETTGGPSPCRSMTQSTAPDATQRQLQEQRAAESGHLRVRGLPRAARLMVWLMVAIGAGWAEFVAGQVIRNSPPETTSGTAQSWVYLLVDLTTVAAALTVAVAATGPGARRPRLMLVITGAVGASLAAEVLPATRQALVTAYTLWPLPAASHSWSPPRPCWAAAAMAGLPLCPLPSARHLDLSCRWLSLAEPTRSRLGGESPCPRRSLSLPRST